MASCNFWSASYSACVVTTKTIIIIIYLSVGESGGYLLNHEAAR